MSTDRKWRVGVAGAVVVLGVSALVQANGGLISSAIADESPKETTTTPQAKVQKPMQTTQPAVQQPAARKGTAQKAATKKKSYW